MSTLSRPLLLSLVLTAACAHTQNAGPEGTEEVESAAPTAETPAGEGSEGAPEAIASAVADAPEEAAVAEADDETTTVPPEAPTDLDFAWDPSAGALALDDLVRGQRMATQTTSGWETRRVGPSSGGVGRGAPGSAFGGLASAPSSGARGRAAPRGIPAPEAATATPEEAILGALGTRGEAESFAADAGEGMRMEASSDGLGLADGLGGLGAKGSASGSGSGGGGLAAKKAASGGRAKRGEGHMRPAPPIRSAPLRAGATDDNAAFGAFVSYLDRMQDRGDIKGWADVLDVTEKRTLRVLSPAGDPLPAARVSLVDPTTERVVWSGHTFGDGRLPVYPNLVVPGTGLPAAGVAPSSGWIVQAEWEGTVSRTRWDGKEDHLDLVVDAAGVSGPVPLDVCFVIDTTGSMGDEIARIKETLLSVTEQLRQEQAVDLRYGAVLYRDLGDAYVTRRHPFTSDLEAFDRALQEIKAGGGGDGPESLNQGLAVAVGGMDWRDDTARVAFVVADAPPHMDYQETVTYGRAAAAALHQGIKIHTVAASGLDDRGSLAFRQVSQLTRGEFIFIEYGSTARSAADHGVAGPVTSNNLDAILYKRIHDEIVGWGRKAEVFTRAR